MTAAAISLACATALQAHHSSGMFELTSAIWVQGTIVRFDRVNPHGIVTLEEKTRDGQVRRWAIEGPDAGQLNRRGIALDFLKAGDVVSFCGFPMKAEWLTQRSSVGADGVPHTALPVASRKLGPSAFLSLTTLNCPSLVDLALVRP